MTQSFNPFAPQAPTTQAFTPPTQPAAPLPQPASGQQQQRTIPKTFADVAAQPARDFGPPRFYEQPGEFDLQILGYAADIGDLQGPRIQITVKVLTSTNPVVAVGFEGRITYKYDHEKNQKSLLDKLGIDLETLVGFVAALYGKPRGQVTQEDELALRSNDWATRPGYVHLRAKLGKPKKSTKDPNALIQFRQDSWFPYKAGQ